MATEEGQVIGCHTIEQWKEQIQKGNESKKLVLLPSFLSSSFSIYIYKLNLLIIIHGPIEMIYESCRTYVRTYINCDIYIYI